MVPILKIKLFIISILVYTSFLLAQENYFHFDQLNADDGLCSNEVTCILQDDLGFMWFGTYSGLAVYDGYDFQIFQHDANDKSSLSGSTIHWGNSIIKDKSSNLWIGTRSGLNKLNPSTRQIEKIAFDSLKINSAGNNWIQCICPTTDGNIWVGTRGGGLYYLQKNNPEEKQKKYSVIHFSKNNNETQSITNDQIHSIFQDDQKCVWVGTDSGLNCIKFSPKENNWMVDNSGFPKTLQKERIIDIYQDKAGDLWLGVKNKNLHRYQKSSNHFEEFTNPDLFYIETIAEDSLGYMWFGSWQNPGIIRYDKQKNEFIKIKDQAVTSHPIENQLIFDIYVDRNNRLWVGTFYSGIYVYDPNKFEFETYNLGKHKDNIEKGSIIIDFLEDKNGKLWMVTKDQGVNVYDPETGNLVNYSHNPDDPNSLSNNNGLSIYEDFNGNKWIGTEWGLNKFISSISGFEKYYRVGAERNNPTHISNNWIWTVLQDKEDTYWIATYYGLNRIYPQTGKVAHYWQEPQEPNFLASVIVFNVFIDHQNIVWVSTVNGLFIVDEEKQCLKKFYAFPDSNFTYNQLVNNFLEDKNKNLWLGTRSGLIKLNPKRKNVEHYTTRNGLLSNIINSLIEDNYGNIWIGTNKGLTRLNPFENSFKNFDKNDGLPGMEISDNAAQKTKTGLLYFGIDREIVIVDPNRIIENKYIPPVHITSFELLKSENKTDKIFSGFDEIILNYDENDFLIKFVALNFTNANKNQYAYKLEGIDDDWVNNHDRRLVSYANVHPGSYMFCVKASNNDGVWNEEGTSIRIIILPPWWQSWWFRSIVLLLILGAIYGIYRLRLNKMLQMERMRVQIASDLHDDIGASLTRIAVHSEIIQSTKNESDVRKSSGRIGTMSREIITTLSDVVWSIDARNDAVGDLLDRMRDFLDTVFPSGEIKIDFQTQGLHFDQKISQDLRQNIYLIFKEAVNNAAKHSDGTEIRIRLTNGTGTFSMEISDNGTGFDLQNTTAGHHGLDNMRMRAVRIGGTLEIESEKGTYVMLKTRAI